MNWSISRHSSSNRRAFSEKGFTLVEILIAISILAILMTSVYGIFSSISLVRERLDSDSADFHRARVLFDRMGRELRGAYFQQRDRHLVFSGKTTDDGSIELELTTTAVSPLSKTGAGLARVHYLLGEDQEGQDQGQVLQRSEYPVYEAADEEAAGMMRLIPGVEAMAIRYYANGQWKTAWDARESGLPEMVEIELQLRSTDGKEPVRFISAFEVPEVVLR